MPPSRYRLGDEYSPSVAYLWHARLQPFIVPAVVRQAHRKRTQRLHRVSFAAFRCFRLCIKRLPRARALLAVFEFVHSRKEHDLLVLVVDHDAVHSA
jgi:hypothetical protein